MTESLGKLLFYRGRVALRALLKAAGVGKGDEVATQAFTCAAVPEGIMAAGARPVWIDVESGGFGMDPQDLLQKVTPTTRAIVVQHTFGIPSRLDGLLDVARRHGLPVIEDCCHTLCSRYRGAAVGNAGAGSFYSFEWGKPIAAGLGGSAIVHDPVMARRLDLDYAAYREPPWNRVWRLELQFLAFWVLYRPSLYWPVRAAYRRLAALGAAEGNFRMPDVELDMEYAYRMTRPSRSRLERHLRRLDQVTRHAIDVVRTYQAEITASGLAHPREPEGAETVYVRYPLCTNRKTELLAAARAASVELADWYNTPIHPLGPAEWPRVSYEAGSCPRAERLAAETVSLPTHLRTTPVAVERAVRFLNTEGS